MNYTKKTVFLKIKDRKELNRWKDTEYEELWSPRNSLVVQWVGHSAFTEGSIPVPQDATSHSMWIKKKELVRMNTRRIYNPVFHIFQMSL